ncbi:hypothetical protein [Zavarzinia sp. CC-PAN008]|uniref:hypothetical protein n=1 Tax=Zavarzinia sp. CC-PAN008 TaxID=3243332 RepID=UPI003F7443A4
MRSAALGICLALLAGSAVAQAPGAQDDITCQVRAMIVDDAPEGLVVRARPGDRARIEGTIATQPDLAVVKLVGYRDGWVHIDGARAGENEEFRGMGWIQAPRLAVSTAPTAQRSVPGRALPNPQGGVATFVPSDKAYEVKGCQGAWVQIRVNQTRVWLAPGDYCARPPGTCPAR